MSKSRRCVLFQDWRCRQGCSTFCSWPSKGDFFLLTSLPGSGCACSGTFSSKQNSSGGAHGRKVNGLLGIFDDSRCYACRCGVISHPTSILRRRSNSTRRPASLVLHKLKGIHGPCATAGFPSEHVIMCEFTSL